MEHEIVEQAAEAGRLIADRRSSYTQQDFLDVNACPGGAQSRTVTSRTRR